VTVEGLALRLYALQCHDLQNRRARVRMGNDWAEWVVVHDCAMTLLLFWTVVLAYRIARREHD
jgi:hypothetical protein